MPPFLVPAETVVVEQELKKSRFIATAGRASNKADAASFIQAVRRTCCWCDQQLTPTIPFLCHFDHREKSSNIGRRFLIFIRNDKEGI